jgi:hypothetical protein
MAPTVAATSGISEETMLRRAALATFALAALLVVACGHQVTPNPSFGDLAGRLVLKFRVAGTLDVNDFTYAIIIDTCGEGTPYPQFFNTSFNSYSYAFFVGGQYGTALPQLFEYFVNPNSNGQIQSVTVPEDPSLEQLILNDNGQGNEFELIFSRAELDNPLRQAQPCPNITPAPTTSAGSSPTATPTATPTGSATIAPASPTPSPLAFPTTPAQEFWNLNYFTIQNRTILDSLGINGPTDTSFPGVVIDTSKSVDVPIFKAVGGPVPSNASAQLSGGDAQNYP